MPQRLNAWRKSRALGARALFVGAIFLIMSVGAVLADSQGTFGGVFHVPVIQAFHSDNQNGQSQQVSNKKDGDENGNSGQNGNGCKDSEDQVGYQCQVDNGHEKGGEGHGHGHGHKGKGEGGD